MAKEPEPQAEAADTSATSTANGETATTETTAAATTASGTTTTTEEEHGDQPATEAVGVVGYEKEVEKALQAAKALEEKQREERFEQGKAEMKEDEAASETARLAKENEAAGETASAATTETSETAASAETPAGETPAETTEPEKEPPNRIRIGRLSEKDRALLASATELAAAEGIDFPVAWARVTGKTEASAPSAVAGEAAASTEAAPVLRTRAEIEKEIGEKKAGRKAAGNELDLTKYDEIGDEIDELRDELRQVEAAEARAEQERQSTEQREFNAAVAASKAATLKDWPEAGDEKSKLSIEMERLAAEYEKNPRLAHHVSEADAPYFFADLGAKNLKLLPKHLRPAEQASTTTKKEPTTPIATKPAAVRQSAVVRPTQPAASPASGAARTTREDGKSAIEQRLDNIRNVTDYEAVEQDIKSGRLALK